MRYRSTILYFLAALLLVGLYFYDVHQDEKKGRLEQKAKVLLGIKSDQVEGIILSGATGTIELQKTEGMEKNAWKITVPIRAATDSPAIEGLKNRLANLKYTRVIAEKTDDLARFGLGDPSFVITYKAGKISGRLAFGSLTPLEDGYYVHKNKDKRIYLVDKFDKEGLSKSLFDLRDKRLFTLIPGKVNRFIIQREKAKWALIKKEGQWRLENDEDFRVDSERIDTMVRKVAGAEALSFEKEAVNEPEPYGLESSAVVVTLSDGKKEQSIFLGNPVKQKQNRIYAGIKGKPPQLVTVNKWLLNDLPQNREEIKKEETAEEKKDTKTHR